MQATMITIEELDQPTRDLINALARHSCKTGEAPFFYFGIRSDHLKDEFNSLMAALRKSGGYFGERHPAYSSLEEFAALTLIQERVRQLHLELLCDPIENLRQIETRSLDLAKLVIRTGDDTGLVPVRKMQRGVQWFEYQQKAFYLAPARVGSLNSSWPISDLLCQSPADPTLLVRPDAFRVIDVRNANARFEKALSHGRPFNRVWLETFKGTVVAQHDPDPANHLIRGQTTQFVWERLDGSEIQFSCEELPHYQNHAEVVGLTPTRFSHGIYDIAKKGFTHFDGAIHIYKEDSYLERLQKHLSAHYMDYIKAKLFRFDSLLNFDFSEMLLSKFFRWNDLVPEYFTYH